MLVGLSSVWVASVAPAEADARTISNIAAIEWTSQSGPLAVRSNRVDILVSPTPPTPIEVGIFRIDPPGGPRLSQIGASGCSVGFGTAATVSAAAPPTGAVSLTPASSFSAGQSVGFGVNSPADNRNPAARENFEVTVRTGNGDLETIRLVEDADNSGFFVGYLVTVRRPPPLVQGDCKLSVDEGTGVRVSIHRAGIDAELASALVSFLVDPFGIVFDSGDGAPVAGVRVTLINADTGAPAAVFGDDGVSPFPSSVVTGSTVTDAGGTSYAFPPGDYRFPFAAPGNYRLLVEPSDPYRWPSTATPAQLASFVRPDNGAPYTIGTASYGAVFQLVTPAPVRIDIPIDQPSAALILRKSSSTAIAVPGDVVQYRIEVRNGDTRRTTGAITVTDELPRALRLRPPTLRYNGTPVSATTASNGRRFDVTLPALAPGASGILTYLAEIRPDAQAGDATNIASARDSRGSLSNVGDSSVRIRRDTLGDRIVIIGRITGGGCSISPEQAEGIRGVRVMLQDGSFTVTDEDGRYHFEGVRPGLSVVQIDPSTLPAGQVPVDCARNVRAAGSAISRFVEGRGGELKRADFRAVPITSDEAPTDASIVTVAAVTAPARPLVAADSVAAGAERDYFAGQTAGIGWLFPSEDYNPRSPSIRIAIKHLRGQTVELSLNGRPVDPLNFDGAQTAPDGSFQVSSWRGVEIAERSNSLIARVLNSDGSLAEELRRSVHYAGSPISVTLVRDRSLLLADGLNRPVIAVRLLDRDGRPAKHGLVGDFTVDNPHRAAVEQDAEQARQLSGLDRARTTWRVEGDDGLAFIELEPTTASGTARLSFVFRDEDTVRSQQIDVWLNPGDRPWTVVGFAAGTIGYNTLDDRMEPVAETLPDDTIDGRIALYAKGRVLGQWLMTLSYDSDKEADEARFGGVIDPRAYYTIYADRADRGFDAASVRNLYLRLERPQFYALFGDFETGINEPELARYQRSLNGVKAEYGDGNVRATAFVADTPYRYRRDEIQGNGLSGPYQLGVRGILANSERITIEIRDRLRSEIIVERRALSRHIDYDIDYFAGTLRFREPILSRDSSLNPQFIVVDYEVDGVGQRVVNAGGRASWTSDDSRLRIGATAIRDQSDSTRSIMGGVDVNFRPDASSEIRAEFAASDTEARNGGLRDTGLSTAWLIEAEHHGSQFDVLAYVREREGGFGVGQLSNAGDASRKFGFDGKLHLSSTMSLSIGAWQEDYLDRDARRRAARLLGEWRTDRTTLRAGLTHAADDLDDGTSNRSTLIQLGATQRLLDNRLEVDAQTEFALDGDDASVDFPARHRLGARFAVSQAVALVGAYEIADGGNVDARTARIGFDVRPWDGARATLSGNQQDIGEFGPRSFAAYGLAQSLQLNERLTVDVTLDGQKTLRGISAQDVLDPAQPVASGGFLDGSGALTEDFTAVTAGATYRTDQWSLTGRAEYRDGEVVNRFGVTIGGIRQLGEGRAFGGLFTWTRADSSRAASTETIAAEMSWAHRPADSRWSFLEKLEFRLDQVEGAVAGQPGPIGGPALGIDGDARSRRVINSLTVNYSPVGEDQGRWHERGEYALFWGLRYAADRFGPDDVTGWSTIVGADLRFDLSETVGVGVAGTARIGTDARARAWSGGPQLVFAPFDNANIVVGYNISGYRDRDFEESRYTRDGLYATFRVKFDQTSLRSLGL
jgi:uncharacterized repeat protein (TIGR01451 family)